MQLTSLLISTVRSYGEVYSLDVYGFSYVATVSKECESRLKASIEESEQARKQFATKIHELEMEVLSAFLQLACVELLGVNSPSPISQVLAVTHGLQASDKEKETAEFELQKCQGQREQIDYELQEKTIQVETLEAERSQLRLQITGL